MSCLESLLPSFCTDLLTLVAYLRLVIDDSSSSTIDEHIHQVLALLLKHYGDYTSLSLGDELLNMTPMHWAAVHANLPGLAILEDYMQTDDKLQAVNSDFKSVLGLTTTFGMTVLDIVRECLKQPLSIIVEAITNNSTSHTNHRKHYLALYKWLRERGALLSSEAQGRPIS